MIKDLKPSLNYSWIQEQFWGLDEQMYTNYGAVSTGDREQVPCNECRDAKVILMNI